MKSVIIRFRDGREVECFDIRLRCSMVYDPEQVVYYLEGRDCDFEWRHIRMFWEANEDKLADILIKLRKGLEKSYYKREPVRFKINERREVVEEI